LLESSVEWNERPLHVAGREGNENIFWFLYSSLAAKLRISKVKNTILKIILD
jgi:hypothetical protein